MRTTRGTAWGLLALLVFFLGWGPKALARDVTVGLSELPGLAEYGPDGQPRGMFVDLFRAMNEFYPEGRFLIRIYPFKRSHLTMEQGGIDIQFPTTYDFEDLEANVGHFSSVLVYPVKFLLYSHRDRPQDPNRLAPGSRIETDLTHHGLILRNLERRGASGVVLSTSVSVESGLLKLKHNRIDGYVFASKSTEGAIHRLQEQGENMDWLVRRFWKWFEMRFLIPEGARGREIDAILIRVMARMRETGRLEEVLGPLLRFYATQPDE